ncbi:MAG: fasciclin domain-containing protein [Phaeodactylibacter sp.]|nr:fasciclin domain-containing protein [Phaeodactylibacter sp.]
MKNGTLALAILLLSLFLAACTRDAPGNAAQAAASVAPAKGQSAVKDDASEQNILNVAIGSRDHSTLVAGVQAAGLEDVLVNAGPLTVFAPNNAAFEKLPAGTLDELLKPENKQKLARIIKYHASPGSFNTDMLKDGMNLYMATGHYVKVERNGDVIKVGGAKIAGTVKASNGIVHVVDAVLLPPD